MVSDPLHQSSSFLPTKKVYNLPRLSPYSGLGYETPTPIDIFKFTY